MSSDHDPDPVLKSRGHQPHLALRIVLPVVVIVAALAVGMVLLRTAPKPERRPPQERASIVELQKLVRTRERISIPTTGTVVPRRAVTIQARVSGRVVDVSPQFIPGGRFAGGEVMLQIDAEDYRLAVSNQQAGLIRARYELAVEQGMQDVARHEWEAMQGHSEGRKFSERERELAMRVPHLRMAEGNLAAAAAQVAQAEVNLARTRVCAPFNAVVRDRYVDLGSQVSPQTPLLELVDTDACWIRVALPAGQARWVTSADGNGTTGSRAAVTSVPGIELQAEWEGTVLRRLADLEPGGRQAQLLVEVPMPGEGATALPFGSYVRVTIEGPEIDNVFSIPGRALRDGRHVWIMNAQDRLEIRPVQVVWSDGERAFIRSGIDEGEVMVLTDINTPLKGMLLTTVEAVATARKNATPRPPESGAKRP